MFTWDTALQILSYGFLAVIVVIAALTLKNRKTIHHWGRRLFVLWALGLALCILVAYRDRYHLSVIAMSDPSVEPGLFSATGLQSTFCMILGALNMFTLISSLFTKKQSYKQTMYYLLSASIVLKVLMIELSILFL